MARKGQKYNKYTSEFKTKIIEKIKQKSWSHGKKKGFEKNSEIE